MILQKSLPYKGDLIKYDLIIKKQKNIVLNINNYKIKVSAPKYVHNREIEFFIYKNIKKITTMIYIHNNYKKIVINSNKTGYIYIFNKKFPLQLTQNNIYAKIVNKQLFLLKDFNNNKENIKKLYNFLKKNLIINLNIY